jgi:hypothetical protein
MLTPEEVRFCQPEFDLPRRHPTDPRPGFRSQNQMTEPPRRLRTACEKYGISEDEFGVTAIGETVRVKVDRKATN